MTVGVWSTSQSLTPDEFAAACQTLRIAAELGRYEVQTPSRRPWRRIRWTLTVLS